MATPPMDRALLLQLRRHFHVACVEDRIVAIVCASVVVVPGSFASSVSGRVHFSPCLMFVLSHLLLAVCTFACACASACSLVGREEFRQLSTPYAPGYMPSVSSGKGCPGGAKGLLSAVLRCGLERWDPKVHPQGPLFRMADYHPSEGRGVNQRIYILITHIYV